MSRTSISRTKEQEEQEKARTRIQCVLRGINELSRRRRREAGLPQLTADPPRQRARGGGGERGTRAAKQEAVAGWYGGDRLEFRVGRQRAAPPSFAPPPNPPRETTTYARGLSPLPSSVSSVPPLRSSHTTHTHTRSLSRVTTRPQIRSSLNREGSLACPSRGPRTGPTRNARPSRRVDRCKPYVDESGPENSSLRLITRSKFVFASSSRNILSNERLDSQIAYTVKFFIIYVANFLQFLMHKWYM